MADDKNKKPNSDSKEAKIIENKPSSAPVNGIEDKLRAAEEGIHRAGENAKAREAELALRKKEAKKENKARLAEAEKKRRADEKEAQRVADAKLAEFDYAQNYRKKLAREKEKAISEAKLREAEARAADARLAKEAEERRIAEILEKDRQEAKARNDRADALLKRIVKREVEEPIDPEERLKNSIAEAIKAYETAPQTKEENTAPEAAPEAIESADAEEVTPKEAEGNEADAEAAEAPDTAPEVAEDSTEEAATEVEPDQADEAEVGEAEADEADEAEEDEGEAEVYDDGEEATLTVDDLPVELSFGKYDSLEDEEEPEADADGDAEDEEDEGDVLAGVDKWFNKSPDEDGEQDEEPAPTEKKKKSFELSFDEDGNLLVEEGDDEDEDEDEDIDPLDEIPASKANPEAQALEEELKAFRDQFKEKYEKAIAEPVKPKKEKASEFSAEELFLTEDVVELIKEKGDALKKNDPDLKEYRDLSVSALNNFKRALKQCKRALTANKDEDDAPRILVSLLKIVGKIVEIRCHNLEVYSRLNSYHYIDNARIALRRDINDYNEYAVIYASLTGEQLTRLSTFLPDNIASGKAEAVVPKLYYEESYVRVLPDENGELHDAEGAMLTQITPPSTADALFGELEIPKSKLALGGYRRIAKRAIKVLDRSGKELLDSLAKTATAERRYERELESLRARTPLERKETDAYKHKEFLLSLKYGKMLTSLRTVKVNSAFDKTRKRLFVGMMAIEREKLAIAIKLLYETYRKGSRSQKVKAQDIFVDALTSYNKWAEKCRRMLGDEFAKLPPTILEKVCRGTKEIKLPVVAYKQTLVETVCDNSRTVSMALTDAVAPDEKAYLENSQKILGNKRGIRDKVSLLDAAPMVDRASAMARVMLDTLRESADSVGSLDEFKLYVERSERVIRFFKRTLKHTERAISRAFDENGVVTALVENLRVITNIIELRRLNISLATRLGRRDYARSEGRALYKNIELYNGRAIDYMSIVGEQFTRITSLPIAALADSADKLRIPTISYKDNFIEVFPKDPLADPIFEKPVQRRAGYYTPLLMKNYRLTENRAVETTVINSPFVFDVAADERPVISWWHPIGFWQYVTVIFQPIVALVRRIKTNAAIWFVDESLVFAKEGLKGRQSKAAKIKQRLERRLARANEKHDAKLMALETVVHDSDRYTAAYHKKLYRINSRFTRKVYRIKMRWMKNCPAQSETRLLLERLVLERERLMGINKVLIKYRNYGRVTLLPNVLVKFRKSFLIAINEHNETARKLSELVGVSFSEVSSAVADEIIRYGNQIKFPQVVCCREIIERVGEVERSIGDRWHGYGVYSGASGTDSEGKSPLMSVGAMGYSTNMGVPYFRADFDNMTMIGMTPGGVPLVGFGSKESVIPFTGTPMMLGGRDDSPVLDAGLEGSTAPLLGGVNVTNPYSGINSAAVDSGFVEREEDAAKNGVTIETPVDIETAMIEERFIRALDARSMTMVDGIKTWWKLIGSEINLIIQRNLFLRERGFLRFLLPGEDEFLEEINNLVPIEEEELLIRISKLGAIIDIECSRLYSATKAGIRRSQRKFSRWLYADIERYNNLVAEYNETVNDNHKNGVRLESEKLKPISLNVPDRIIHRLDDRPYSPPRFRFRNKVRTAPYGWRGITEEMKDGEAVLDALNTGNVEERIEKYVLDGLNVFPNFFRMIGKLFLRARIFILKWPERAREESDESGEDMSPLAIKLERPFREALLRLYSKEIKGRAKRTAARRSLNEVRHYYLRYEKARAMKRYNRRIVRAIGLSHDPIKYQSRLHRVLRKYISCNFRIDYNMRIYQLIVRFLRVDFWLYVGALAALFIAVIVAAITSQPASTLVVMSYIFVAWAALPVAFKIVELIYWIIFGIIAVLRSFFGNRPPIQYGAKDVESNRYGLVLNCFVCEQHKILAAVTLMRYNTASRRYRKSLIAAVDEYNKSVKTYSEVLRVHIDEIEITELLDKIIMSAPKRVDARGEKECGGCCEYDGGSDIPLTEIQNFYYVRELIQINDFYTVGKDLAKRESATMIEGLNRLIAEIANRRDQAWRDEFRGNLQSDSLSEFLMSDAIDDFSNGVSLMISAIQSNDPTLLDDEQRFDLKNRLVWVLYQLGELGFMDPTIARDHSRAFIKLIDHIGGLQEKVIVTTLALDNMIF